jgi:hypothetical protein
MFCFDHIEIPFFIKSTVINIFRVVAPKLIAKSSPFGYFFKAPENPQFYEYHLVFLGNSGEDLLFRE